MSSKKLVKFGELMVLWAITFAIVFVNTSSWGDAAVSACIAAPTKWTSLRLYYWGINKRKKDDENEDEDDKESPQD